MFTYKNFIEYIQSEVINYFGESIHSSQFKYNDFNNICFNKMFATNDSFNIKSVDYLKKEIKELDNVCKNCRDYYINQRSKSYKDEDIKMGNFIEDVFIKYMRNELNLNIVRADTYKKSYPDCKLLDKNNNVICYFEIKYHGSPFLTSKSKINRHCYEGSATLDYDKLVKQLDIIEKELDKPTYYLHWIDYPCLKGLYYETAEEVRNYLKEHGKEFDRKEHEGDFKTVNKEYSIVKKIGYTKKFYTPLLMMNTFENLLLEFDYFK